MEGVLHYIPVCVCVLGEIYKPANVTYLCHMTVSYFYMYRKYPNTSPFFVIFLCSYAFLLGKSRNKGKLHTYATYLSHTFLCAEIVCHTFPRKAQFCADISKIVLFFDMFLYAFVFMVAQSRNQRMLHTYATCLSHTFLRFQNAYHTLRWMVKLCAGLSKIALFFVIFLYVYAFLITSVT